MRTVPTFGRQTDVLYGVDSYAISGGKDVFVYGSKEATTIDTERGARMRSANSVFN